VNAGYGFNRLELFERRCEPAVNTNPRPLFRLAGIESLMTMRTTMGDWQLLQAYARDRSEAAFAELVRLHLNWVYSVALRHVGDSQLAEDVAQSVFVLLARKAHELRPGTLVGGWLFRTTCLVAGHARRAEQRRKRRETTACTMSPDTASPDTDEILWEQLAPHLDQAVAALSEADRSAILLRFYEKMPLHQVGEKLGVSEEAAKKRVSRAVEKLREFLERRGVKLTGLALAAVLADKTVQTASAALAGTVIKLSIAAASAAGSTALPQLAREILNAWRWARLKLVAGLGAGSLALVFVAVTVGGKFIRGAAPRPSSASGSATVTANALVQSQDVNHLFAPADKEKTQAPRKTGALTGWVVDDRGRPVSGAVVWGGFCGQAAYAQDTTDQSGQFALNKIAAPPYVTVTADGFAADQQGFDLTNVPGPLAFRLNPVPPLKVRLVDEAGQGVAGAGLFLYQWWGQAGTLAQHLAQRTDAEGRLQWLSPPKGELELHFTKAGYRYSRTNKLTADGIVHTIVLHPTATVTGSVTDAETGSPVPSFKFTLGRSQPWNPSDQTPMWDLGSKIATNGFYKVLIEEEHAPYLRIEADGYETVEAPILLTNALESVRDFPLKRLNEAHSIRGTVLLPDGKPAAGVEVALCTANVGVMLKGTAFEPGAFGNLGRGERDDYRRKTDEQGFFSFPPKPGAHTLAAVGPAGLGQIRCFDFSQPFVIKLQAWGRIEGNVRTRDNQWAGRKVTWDRPGNLTRWMTVEYKPEGCSARSDATGKFLLEHVPPGDSRAAIDDGPEAAPILSRSVHVNPGETVQVQVGGVGRPVKGRLVAPRGVEIRNWTKQVTLARLHVEWADYHVPKELTGSAVERWKLEFEDTEAGRAWFRDQYAYGFKVAADGSFSIPEVLPGNYHLFVSVEQGYLGSGPDSTTSRPSQAQIANTGMKIVVPDSAADYEWPLDLGDIVLNATH
jgi:RNA polymerase sigma factor (sigma-70 family)